MIDVHVVDQNALQARSPVELALYLRARQWVSRGQAGTHVQWTKTVDGDEFETTLPMDSELRDYSSRVRDLIETLAVVEGRSELDVLQDISFVSMDGHYVRTHPADRMPGMIGLEDGVLAYESLRNLVVAAAYAESVDEPRAVQPARKSAELLKFLREVQIGPGSEGSYVLSVHTPVRPKLTDGQATLFDDEFPAAEPFERRVTLRLHEAVSAAHAAANAALAGPDLLGPFTGSIRRGVSANLCEALVGLGGEAGHPFEIFQTLAPARPSRAVLKPMRFRRDHLPVLAEAAQELRERMPEEDVAVTGHVVRLHRESGASGEVSVAGIIEGEDRLRRIWLNLEPDDYESATRAHMEMLKVTVRGDLARRGNRSFLTNVHAFQVASEDEDA